MTSVCWKSAVTWSLLGLMFLLFALVLGAVPALASNGDPDAILYEVTEDMYLKDGTGKFVTSAVAGGRRTAVARLSGWAKLGTPLCPLWVQSIVPNIKKCSVNASGADDLSLATGQGTLSGTYVVTVQDNNVMDGPEFVIMGGTFKGDADLSKAFTGTPLGFITNGAMTVDGLQGLAFGFSGTFRLPFAPSTMPGLYGKAKRNHGAYYLGSDGLPFRVRYNEKSLGVATVRIEINFAAGGAQVVEDEADDTNN